MFRNSLIGRAALLASSAALAVVAVAGCSSNSSNTPSASPTTTSATAAPAACTSESILAALPSGSTMLKFNCADVTGTQWAAVKVDPGPTVFFLQEKNSTWSVSTADSVCGTASAGLPDVLLNYCTSNNTGTPTASPAGVSCTSASILSALPEGSTMVKFNCATVGGTLWAATKVRPGPTVFFLQQKGSKWKVSTADSVCGTASAGLPNVILDYCS